MLVLVAASDFAIDSVDGQRARPSGVMRFDLLNVVGSRPARLGKAGGGQAGARGKPVDAPTRSAHASAWWIVTVGAARRDRAAA